MHREHRRARRIPPLVLTPSKPTLRALRSAPFDRLTTGFRRKACPAIPGRSLARKRAPTKAPRYRRSAFRREAFPAIASGSLARKRAPTKAPRYRRSAFRREALRVDFLHAIHLLAIANAHGCADDSTMDIISNRAQGHASLRRGRHSEPGRTYLITFVTFNRERIFTDWAAAALVARASLQPSIWRASRPLCWVLMPEHWHGLIELGEMDTLSTLVNRIKGSTARIVNASREKTGNVWARGYHDHALRADEALLPVARYIISNPIRAGLVQRVGMYPFWDAVWLDSPKKPNSDAMELRSKASAISGCEKPRP